MDCMHQVLELAALRDDKLFFFYDDVSCLEREPRGYRTAYEDDVAITEEVYYRLTFYNCHIRSVSLSVRQLSVNSLLLLLVFVLLFF